MPVFTKEIRNYVIAVDRKQEPTDEEWEEIARWVESKGKEEITCSGE